MLNKDFWISSAKHLKETKYLAIMGIFIALKVIAGFVSIPVAENLFVGISFLFSAIEASIIGPVAALVSGFVTDIVSFMLDSKGYSFFPGYTLSEMLGIFIYALFFYRQRITITKIFCAKFLVNYGVNALLGSLWSTMIMSKGYWFYFSQSVIKNTILLPFEVLALTLLFNLLIPVLSSKNLIFPQETPIKFK